MSRKVNILSYILTMVVTLVTLFIAVYLCNERYGGTMIDAVMKFIIGAIIAGICHTFAHELGHLIAGKRAGFAFSSMTVWFFKWSKRRSKIRFDLVMIGEEAGYTEMIPKSPENMEKKLKKMTMGGLIASFVLTLFGLAPFFMKFLPVWVFSIWAMFLPIGAYFFFGNFLPASSYGARNDGAVLYGLRKNDDESKVTVAILKYQADLYSGKTPSEIDESILFNTPQLPEDSLNFALLLNAKYAYYLDKGDYENAKKTTERLLSLEDYLPKEYMNIVKTDALYNACTFDFNEDKADDLMYELEKYLNNVNTVTNVRVKLAYLLNVKQEKEGLDMFFTKGYKEADRCQIKGLGLYERKLFDALNKAYQTIDK